MCPVSSGQFLAKAERQLRSAIITKILSMTFKTEDMVQGGRKIFSTKQVEGVKSVDTLR